MAAMMYNAVVKHVPGKGDTDGGQEIGRVYLDDLAIIPERWTILFRGARISHNTDIGELLCSATDPITIYKGFLPPVVMFCVSVHTLTGKILQIEMHANETVEQLAEKIQAKEGIPPDQQRLISYGRQLEFGRILMEYNILDNCVVHLVLRLRGGGGFMAQDVEAKQLTLKGRDANPSKPWKAYSRGMNLYGVCPSSKCPSRENGQRKQVSFKAGYGTILLTPGRATFRCSACEGKYGNICLVPISQFVLSCGRAVFRFKKSGAGHEVKTVVMESEDDIELYKTFDQQAGQSEYDFIEIATVAPDSSFHYCVKCDWKIRDKCFEVILECGHSYHARCAKAMGPHCLVCKAYSIASVYDLLGFDTGNTHDKGCFCLQKSLT